MLQKIKSKCSIIIFYPFRYFSEIQIIWLIFLFAFGGFPFTLIRKCLDYITLLHNGVIKVGSFSYYTVIIYFIYMLFDTIVSLPLLWKAIHYDTKHYLKLLLCWQIPVGYPLIVYEVCLCIIFWEYNGRWGIIFRTLSAIYRIYIIIIVYSSYRQLSSGIIAKLNEYSDCIGKEIENKDQDIWIPDPEESYVTLFPKDEFKKHILSPLDIWIDTSKIRGEGQFGCVFYGTWKNEEVAVKISKTPKYTGIDDEEFKVMMQELKTLMIAGNHENIVKFHGVTSHKSFQEFQQPICTVLEQCENGSLDNFLINNRSTFNFDQLEIQEDNSGLKKKFILGTKMTYVNLQMHGTHSIIDLLRIAREIACGMQHLVSKHIIHGDLAARNVLLTSNLHVKLTDFGMSRKLNNYQIYCKAQETQKLLPWRWMSIEAIVDFKFSEKSDVWSYGVLIWEIFTLGEFPFQEIEWNENFIQKLRNGLRLKEPEYAPEFICQLMKLCCNTQPKDRPSFREILENLLNFDFEHKT